MIGDAAIETRVACTSHVGWRYTDTEYQWYVAAACKLVVTNVAEVVDCHIHTVENLKVETDVELLGLFPCYVVVAEVAFED